MCPEYVQEGGGRGEQQFEKSVIKQGFKTTKLQEENIMKKLLLGLLSLSLVLAFAMPAAAVDVNVSGQFYVGGIYEDNQDLLQNETATGGSSSAWYVQRLRVNTIFAVNPALKLVTRFDAMEGYWNGTSGPTEYANAGTRDDDNIDFDRAYVEFGTPYGMFYVGYMAGGVWGTIFGDAEIDVSRIKWQNKYGAWLLGGVYQKSAEADKGTTRVDDDTDVYYLYFVNYIKGGAWGILWAYADVAAYKAAGFDMCYQALVPFVKYKNGPLYVEAEANYKYGTYADYDSAAVADIDYDAWTAYVKAQYAFGKAYVGGQVAYVKGDDPNTRDKENGDGGADYDPMLILWNSDLYMWRGSTALGANGTGGQTTTDTMLNAWLYQVYAGYVVNPKLRLFASYSMAKADEQYVGSTTTRAVDDEIGTEFDITATYKIMDNLDYMVGFGYFWTGDWYKGSSTTNKIDDDYLVMHKLTLNF